MQASHVRTFISMVALLMCATFAHAQQPHEPQQPQQSYWFGDFEHQINDLQSPSDIAITQAGDMFIVERDAPAIVRVDRAGVEQARVEKRGSGPGELLAPSAISLSSDGNIIIVADQGNHRLSLYTHDLEHIRDIGSRGIRQGEFNRPLGVVARNGEDDRIFVADTGNDRVQVFDANGDFLMAFGSRGEGDGDFRAPVDIAFDREGLMYVVDRDNARVQVFASDGTFLRTFGEWGPFIGLLDEPTSVTVHNDEVLITDRNNHRVQAFTTGGEFISAWGVHELLLHEGGGKIHYPQALAIAPDGSFAAIAEPLDDRVQLFAAAPVDAPRTMDLPTDKAEMTHFGNYLDVGKRLMVIAEPELHTNLIFDLSAETPIIINRFGERGDGFGLLLRPTGVALDEENHTVFLLDSVKKMLQEFRYEFDADAPLRQLPHMTSFARSIDLEQMVKGRDLLPLDPVAIACSDASVYVLDRANCCVLVIQEHQLAQVIGTFGNGDGAFLDPADLAISWDGKHIYVTDPLRGDVQTFTSDGEFISAVGAEHLQRPFGVAAATDGLLYVTDTAADRVVVLHPSSNTLVQTWGTRGTDMGEFWKPRGIDVGPNAQIYVIDYGNHRAQIFSHDGEWKVTFGTGRAYTQKNRPK
ncbi:MAG: NHL repeat-containing protein [Phycisphaerales bacterium]